MRWGLSFVASGVLLMAVNGAQADDYFVYDGQKYRSEQLAEAAVSPMKSVGAVRNRDGSYSVARAADGHYYVGGSVNGFPVVFLVDTGAKFSGLPNRMASNAGIRAGKAITLQTAAGPDRAGLSAGNTIVVGPFVVRDAAVVAGGKLDQALLGVEVLNRFQVTYGNGVMTLREN